ncbi:MAG: alpha/beta hydrolase [SAR202 cluster bacterium]|nr:alpha/beta hydrolase [SAR202 cluster bacterium]
MASLRPDIQEKWVTVNGLKIRYWEKGSGMPLVCVHGLGPVLSADQWLLVADDFSKFARVIALDMPGWGESDFPPAGTTDCFQLFSDVLKGFCDALGLKQVDVMGQSMGGWDACLFAYDHPEMVRRIVLVGNAGLNPPLANIGQPFKLPEREEIRNTLVREWREFHPITDEIVEALYQRMHAKQGRVETMQAIRDAINNAASREKYSLRTRLPKMQQPILAVWGDDAPGIRLVNGIDAFQLAPNARLQVCYNGDHSAMGYAYDQFLPAARRFLTQAEVKPAQKLPAIAGT